MRLIARPQGWNPIPSVTGLLEGHGIKVIEADLPVRFDGLACGVKRSSDRADTDVVVTSRRTSVERRRLTFWRTSWPTS